MKRRDFFKGLLGLACLPFIPKVAEAKSVVILPPVTEPLTFPNHAINPYQGMTIKQVVDQQMPYIIAQEVLGCSKDKTVWYKNHWCKGNYEPKSFHPGIVTQEQLAEWVCRCEPIEVEIVKVRCDSHVLDEKWTCKTFIRGL